MGICHGRDGTGASLHQAASLYHQERFDSALARLESMRIAGPWKRRDSLAYFQYSGMAASRLGRSPEAVAHFSRLLALDTLFQFPRNEDPQVLENFARAKSTFSGPGTVLPSESAALVENAPAMRSPAGYPGGATAPLQETGDRQGEGGFSFIDSGAANRTGRIAAAADPKLRGIGLAYGAWPAGAGWLARGRRGQGLALGLLQAGGLGLSLYASHRVSREEGDRFAIRDRRELESVKSWQLTQRLSLSTALGAYLFSLIASAGD